MLYKQRFKIIIKCRRDDEYTQERRTCLNSVGRLICIRRDRCHFDLRTNRSLRLTSAGRRGILYGEYVLYIYNLHTKYARRATCVNNDTGGDIIPHICMVNNDAAEAGI